MSNTSCSDELVNLLWTGGWDSTFRLIWLLLLTKRVVQPYYVVDPVRRSSALERRTMQKITDQLGSDYPEIRTRLLSLKVKNSADIPTAPAITACYQRLRSRVALGSQYEWLARFAHAEKIVGLEMSLTYRGGVPFQLLAPMVKREGDPENPLTVVGRDYKGSDVYGVFKYFRFPLFDKTKLEMRVLAEKEGFYDLMLLTRFCHRPRANDTPCGVCNPCIALMEHGFEWRLPWASRLRYYLWIRGKQNIKRLFPRL